MFIHQTPLVKLTEIKELKNYKEWQCKTLLFLGAKFRIR